VTVGLVVVGFAVLVALVLASGSPPGSGGTTSVWTHTIDTRR
jgi:hypothetical protein